MAENRWRIYGDSMGTIRVLQVIGGLNRGGAETMVMNLYRAIDKNRVQFDFVIHNEKENAYCEEIKSMGGQIFVFPKFRFSDVLGYQRYWDDFLNEHPEYKIVHSHVRSYATFIFAVAHKHGLKTIIHSHSTSNGSGMKGFLKTMLQYPLRYQSDYFFSCSSEAGKWLFGEKVTKQPNYMFIKNAIDTEKYRFNSVTRNACRDKMNLNGKIVYGHVGRLSEPKNHKFLLEIFKDLRRDNDRAVLLIVGEGSYRTAIEEQIKQLELTDSVILTGARDDIPELLQAMDVFLFPSLWEGLPVTVIEAQSTGLPCLVSDKVTTEVAVSEAVMYLPIDCGVNCWVEAAKDVVGKRYDVIELVKAAGFDVATSAAELLNEYRSIYLE